MRHAGHAGFVDAQPQADASRIGAVGYCMSGPFVMWAAAAFPERIRCIASIHGANMATDKPDSPHRVAPKLRCESYFACAETDKWAPPADIEKLQARCRRRARRTASSGIPGVEHGFVFPLRAGIYNQAAAERHWERLFTLGAVGGDAESRRLECTRLVWHGASRCVEGDDERAPGTGARGRAAPVEPRSPD
jgi:dienelactone hydrolase